MISQYQREKWQPPTEAQAKAGNYYKPRINCAGMEVAIENPIGTVRQGVDEDGKPWATQMLYHYGYIVGSKGSDGDMVDVYIGDDISSEMVYVVHQAVYGDWDKYDEDKCMLFFASEQDAIDAYLSHYDDPRFLGSVTAMPLEKFKTKVMAGDGKMIKAHTVDLSGMSCCGENHALEILSKAISEDVHDIWASHENNFISHIIELFTERGLLRIDSVNKELEAWLEGKKRHGGAVPSVPVPGMQPYWSKDELDLVRLYLESLPSDSWTLSDYDYLVQYLFQRYMPEDELMSDAEWLITRAYFMGKAQHHLGDVSAIGADAISAGLPVTIAEAFKQFHMSDAAKHIIEYAKLTAMDNVVSMSRQAQHKIKGTVLDHINRKMSGDESANEEKLQQDLFDDFAAMNRDWRRIALTEAGEACNQGFIASLPDGAKVRRMEMYKGACPFCKKINGRVFNVVSPGDPNKNGETDVWVGKTNIGRSASPRKRTENGLEVRDPSDMWWVPAGVAHPHCRGRWMALSSAQPGDGLNSLKFANWFKQRTGTKEGFKLSEYSPYHE